MRVDASGYFYGDDLMSATEVGKCISYVFRHPETGENALKHTWIVCHDGLLFASGFYEEELINEATGDRTKDCFQAQARYGWSQRCARKS